MPKIKLFLADVDGTLVTEDKILTERAIAAVADLEKNGVRFAMTSGRPPRGMEMLIEPLKLSTPIAGFNGGVFARPDLSVIEERTLPRKVAQSAIELILDHKMDVWVYTGMQWLLRDDKAPHVAREQWTVKFPPEVAADFDGVLDKATKIVGISDDHDLVARCEADMQKAVGDHASAARSQPYYLDVTHPQANKGDVVIYLSKELGIPTDQIATIGDMPNDVLMFRKSGMSIAMGNASAEVQKQATHVTASYKEEGFAKAIERYILGDGKA
jgi:hypothetical protein